MAVEACGRAEGPITGDRSGAVAPQLQEQSSRRMRRAGNKRKRAKGLHIGKITLAPLALFDSIAF